MLWLCVSVAAAVKSPGKLDSSFMDGEEGNFSLQHLSHLNPRLCNYSENGIGWKGIKHQLGLTQRLVPFAKRGILYSIMTGRKKETIRQKGNFLER